MAKEKKEITKCIQLKGELAHLGKHIMITEIGFTLCGMPTVDYDRKTIPNMIDGFPSEYTVEEWDITCKWCLEFVDIMEKHNEYKKTIN